MRAVLTSRHSWHGRLGGGTAPTHIIRNLRFSAEPCDGRGGGAGVRGLAARMRSQNRRSTRQASSGQFWPPSHPGGRWPGEACRRAGGRRAKGQGPGARARERGRGCGGPGATVGGCPKKRGVQSAPLVSQQLTSGGGAFSQPAPGLPPTLLPSLTPDFRHSSTFLLLSIRSSQAPLHQHPSLFSTPTLVSLPRRAPCQHLRVRPSLVQPVPPARAPNPTKTRPCRAPLPPSPPCWRSATLRRLPTTPPPTSS